MQSGLGVLQHGIKDSRSQNHLCPNLSVSDLDWVSQRADVDVVGAPDEDHMHTAHARKEGNDAEGHDLVLPEEAFIADVATRQAESNDDEGENGTPPAVEEGRVVGGTGTAFWRRLIVDTAREYHAAERTSQTLTSGEGALLVVACSVTDDGRRWVLEVQAWMRGPCLACVLRRWRTEVLGAVEEHGVCVPPTGTGKGTGTGTAALLWARNTSGQTEGEEQETARDEERSPVIASRPGWGRQRVERVCGGVSARNAPIHTGMSCCRQRRQHGRALLGPDTERH